LGGRGKEILCFGSGFWVLDPAPTATKIVLGHGTEIEATLSLLRAIPRKNDVLSYWVLNSINRKIEKVWWSFVEKCGDGMKYLRNQNREKLNIESTGTLTRSQILYKTEHGIVLIFS